MALFSEQERAQLRYILRQASAEVRKNETNKVNEKIKQNSEIQTALERGSRFTSAVFKVIDGLYK